MKGILLAGGSGRRLLPLTMAMSKQLLPIYDKPMIYYPLATLMLAGIRDILVISTPRDVPVISKLLGAGEELGLNISYAEQERPRGIAEAFVIGETFVNDESVSLVLGDNMFHGRDLTQLLTQAAQLRSGALIFGVPVKNPERYGVVEMDGSGKVLGLVEKPTQPSSNLAVPGLYFYDADVVGFARELTPSARGELEITDINKRYLQEGRLEVLEMGRGIAWLDAGTHDSLLSASTYVQTLQKRQGLQVACVEEIAFAKKMIGADALLRRAERFAGSEYGAYLKRVSMRALGMEEN